VKLTRNFRHRRNEGHIKVGERIGNTEYNTGVVNHLSKGNRYIIMHLQGYSEHGRIRACQH